MTETVTGTVNEMINYARTFVASPVTDLPRCPIRSAALTPFVEPVDNFVGVPLGALTPSQPVIA